MEDKYDLGIVGAGPAGYTAALHASSLGKRVVLFEKDEIGGVCLNRGCIPTKSIIHASEMFYNLKNCEDCGIFAENINFDFSRVVERKTLTVEKLRKGIELALKNAKIAIIRAEAKILDSKTIESENKIFKCEKIICAAGSSPREIKGLEFDHKFILSSDDILNLEALPNNILIIGSGAIGIEWARIMSNFGVSVTVVELAPHLLPVADIEVSKRIERIFKIRNIKFYTDVRVENIQNEFITLSNGDVLTPETVLVAAGRVPNKCKNVEGVTYIGDIAGEIQLAHFAIKQAIEEIDGIKFDKTLTPSVVYGTPEIAWVGLREQDLEPDSYRKHFMLVSALGKSHCDGQTEGFIKILSVNDKIVGAHIVCAEASSLIQQIVIAMQNGVSVDKLKEICFAHPTYSEGIFEALFK